MSAELERLKASAIVIADILDGGERDPSWAESQELENAAIAFGRTARNQSSESTATAGTRASLPPRPDSSRSRRLHFSITAKRAGK